jgi:glutamate/aspartate transport system substrate-binding protein
MMDILPRWTAEAWEPDALIRRFAKAGAKYFVSLAKSGDVARIYDKWFLKPIPPQNVIVGLPATEMTKAAWANPTDKPMEEYEAR